MGRPWQRSRAPRAVPLRRTSHPAHFGRASAAYTSAAARSANSCAVRVRFPCASRGQPASCCTVWSRLRLPLSDGESVVDGSRQVLSPGTAGPVEALSRSPNSAMPGSACVRPARPRAAGTQASGLAGGSEDAMSTPSATPLACRPCSQVAAGESGRGCSGVEGCSRAVWGSSATSRMGQYARRRSGSGGGHEAPSPGRKKPLRRRGGDVLDGVQVSADHACSGGGRPPRCRRPTRRRPPRSVAFLQRPGSAGSPCRRRWRRYAS